MSIKRVTKHQILSATRGGLRFTIPAGVQVEQAEGQPKVYWVKPEAFPLNSIERHDAIYYGVSVDEDETEEINS